MKVTIEITKPSFLASLCLFYSSSMLIFSLFFMFDLIEDITAYGWIGLVRFGVAYEAFILSQCVLSLYLALKWWRTTA